MKNPHVLLTTDLSDDSVRAFGPVGELARGLGGRITLLFVLTELMSAPAGYPFVPVATPLDVSEQSARARERLDELTEKLGAGLDVKTEVVIAARADSGICEYADAHDVDLIAMSTHGRSGVRRLFLGSVAEAVLRSAKQPVIVFPPDD